MLITDSYHTTAIEAVCEIKRHFGRWEDWYDAAVDPKASDTTVGMHHKLDVREGLALRSGGNREEMG